VPRLYLYTVYTQLMVINHSRDISFTATIHALKVTDGIKSPKIINIGKVLSIDKEYNTKVTLFKCPCRGGKTNLVLYLMLLVVGKYGARPPSLYSQCFLINRVY
jgi:hypothetical protein